MKQHQHLTGKHAIVLGASSDIGAAAAKLYAWEGVAALTLTYGSNQGPVERLARMLRKQGVKVYVAHHDRSDFGAMKKLLESAVKANGQEIDIAADFIATSPDLDWKKQTPDLWRKVLDVNLVGCFVSSKAICDRMTKKNKGRVKGYLVIVTSINGRITFGPYSAPYNSSKAGQESLVRDLSIQYGRIHTNGVAPAWVKTKMNRTVEKEVMDWELKKGLAKGQATPDQVASWVVALSSDRLAGYHHGEIIDIKGGYGIR